MVTDTFPALQALAYNPDMNANRQPTPAGPRWLLAVDIGNHGLKLERRPCDHRAAVGPGPQLTIPSTAPPLDALANWLPTEPLDWMVAAVRRDAERQLDRWVREHRPQDTYCRLTQPMIPIRVDVEQPSQVGIDRILAALAASRQEPGGCYRFVVDAGSAVTVDRVSPDDVFEGGAILPGWGMMAAMLARQTDLLPETEPNFGASVPGVVGRSTEAAIRSGVYWGMVGAVRELLRRMAVETAEPGPILVTGGDGGPLAAHLTGGRSVRHVPNLVIDGIVATYRHRQQPQGVRGDPLGGQG